MPIITGLTAARMLAIEAASIVSGAFNAAAHLILTSHDGTLIDAGAVPSASATAQGIVQLATSLEVTAGSVTNKAVTPAGFAAGYAAFPGNKVQVIPSTTTIAETATPGSYPAGVSLMSLSASAWGVNSGYGSVLTNNTETDRCVQMFYSNNGGTGFSRSWMREYHSTNGGGGWTAWSEYQLMANLTPGSYTQATAFTSYPSGNSRIYYSSSNSTSWDFTGKYGELLTYVSGSDFAKQRWTAHASGIGSKPDIWERTANAANGWSSWVVITGDPGAWTSYTPTWTAATTNPVLGNGTLVGRYMRSGRTITFDINLIPGTTTTFGSGNYAFAIPVPAANAGESLIGNAQLLETIRWMGQTVISPNATTTSPFFPTSTADSTAISMSPTAPQTFASAHQLRMTGIYEAAS